MDATVTITVTTTVPVSRLPDLYEYLGRPAALANVATDAASEAVIQVATGPQTWTAETLRRCYRESSRKMQMFLDHLAEHAGRAISGNELSQTIGYDVRQMSGMLGAAGRRITNHYHLPFPYTQEWRSTENQFYYTMRPEDAEVIVRLRADH